MMPDKISIWIISLSFLILISCGSNSFKDYHSFTNNCWNTDSIISLKIPIIDTTKKYDLSLRIRHTVNYEFQNLFLFLDHTNRDTVEIILADKNGKWLGKGVSDLREFDFLLEKGKYFPKNEKDILLIEQAMRYGPLEKIIDLNHISDIGLIITESDE